MAEQWADVTEGAGQEDDVKKLQKESKTGVDWRKLCLEHHLWAMCHGLDRSPTPSLRHPPQ